jgi:hypothetical protein
MASDCVKLHQQRLGDPETMDDKREAMEAR